MISKFLNFLKNIFKKKGFKITAIIVVIVAVIAFIFRNKIFPTGGDNVQVAELKTANASIGDISSIVSGTGTLISSQRYELTIKNATTVLEVYKKEGDIVKEGELIAKLDTFSANSAIEKQQRSISKANDTQSENIKKRNDLKVYAPADGYITELKSVTGDSIAADAVIMSLKNNDKYKTTAEIYNIDYNSVRAGQEVRLFIYDYLSYMKGYVTYVSDDGKMDSAGNLVHEVEITLEADNRMLDGLKAGIEIKTDYGYITSKKVGTIEYDSNVKVKSSAGGTITALYAKNGQFVNKGELLLELENKTLENTIRDQNYSLQDLYATMDDLKETLEDCMVYAPCDGIIASLPIKPNDTLSDNGKLVTVLNNVNMQFTVSIDELDIEKLQVGQKASITVDAVPSTLTNPIIGEVSTVAFEGKAQNGVTTYETTIVFEAPEGIKPGMNVNVDIYISDSQGILTIPLEAVNKMRDVSFVMVKSNEKYNPDEVPESIKLMVDRLLSSEYYKDVNAKPVIVELGVNNDILIEVKSGLKEGDEIILPEFSASMSGFDGGGMGGNGMRMRPMGGGGVVVTQSVG